MWERVGVSRLEDPVVTPRPAPAAWPGSSDSWRSACAWSCEKEYLAGWSQATPDCPRSWTASLHRGARQVRHRRCHLGCNLALRGTMRPFLAMALGVLSACSYPHPKPL